MKTGYHKCPVPTCKREVQQTHLMCSQHWFKVPVSIQTAIYRTYHAGLRHKDHPSDEYIACVEAALQHIANLPAPQGAQPQHA